MSHQDALSTEESDANSSSWVTGLEPHRCPMAHASFDGQRRWSQGFNKDNTDGSQKSEERCPSVDITEDKTSSTPDDELLSISGKDTQHVPNLIQELDEYPIGYATPTAPRTTTYHQNRFTSLSRTYGDGSKLWAKDIMLTGFTGSSKKAGSRISYSVSPRGGELRLKHKEHFCRIQSQSSTKTTDAKRLPNSTNRSGQSSPEPLTCIANVMVTVGDRGWREYDTQITIDIDEQSDWRICVRLTEGTKYSHKVCRVLQPGATNRYTHAMMWKGGPEWYLEFPDRRQWFIFKQMHDECYSHNIRAACVKNIPIPGVCLVEGHDDNDGVPFVRQQGYICHVGPDVEMALDKSCLMYDMDNDDEDWISRWNKSLEGKDDNTACELTDDMFERIMDKFEKFAYTHNCNQLTIDQLSELDMDNVPLDIIKVVHDYWHDKRQTKGMPLVRHFQVPSKGQKQQRSHKKLTYSRCHRFSRKQNGFRRQGRKHNEYAGDGRMCESYDGGSLHHPPTGFSMRTEKKNASSMFSEDQRPSPSSFLHRKIKQGGAPDQPSLFSEDHKLRDAASSAQHAAMMTRLKREKAHCLAQQADLALHKASVVLMVADAIKASSSRDPSRSRSRVVGNRREGSS